MSSVRAYVARAAVQGCPQRLGLALADGCPAGQLLDLQARLRLLGPPTRTGLRG